MLHRATINSPPEVVTGDILITKTKKDNFSKTKTTTVMIPKLKLKWWGQNYIKTETKMESDSKMKCRNAE